MKFIYILSIFAMTVGAAPAVAKPLTSVWKLETETSSGRQTTSFGEPFLVQRMVPARVVKTTAAQIWTGKKTLPADTHLFKVFQADGKTAYCTVKDQSVGNVAKSLFIPALDRRPCFIDANFDGEFEAAFTVFDKYGSALTPSGNISSAKPIHTPIRYTNTDSAALPKKYTLSFSLSGSREPEKASVSVVFAQGDGAGEQLLVRIIREGARMKLVNLDVAINSIVGKDATITVGIDSEGLLLGDSGGFFYGAKSTELPAGWEK
jgi:hypothetical protein